MRMLAEVAMRYARQHGMNSATVSWEETTEDQHLLLVETGTQTVVIPFSIDEIEDFPGGTGTDTTKRKIRDKFAGLSM
jgi:hypothetical protein